MAKISLRAYNHEITNLIDHGQTEEASAHCKYILKIFPKHLDTYRLLGKTYLESQRYSEAADILQRVLAVVPDDFVSQIGLSIIREDEGNLDAAIWNMERAFEVQPSNAAVQEELRRLYGNRDGVQPPRVRLTRGALVRMYTKGDLYQQAIAEARAAIAESPKRTDLEILLARNYYLSKNYVEATEICSRLVKKMPYCYEANCILADILPKANKSEEAKIFAKRVQELDPYAAFTDRSAATVDQVPDDAVTLEKLEWQPSMEEAEQPRWAKSIGVDIGSQTDQPSTDWLSDLPESRPESSAPMPFIIPEISSTKSDESLPGWMKEDEWSTGKDAEAQGGNQQSNAFIMDDAENLQAAEVPEWLQSMAPDDIDQGQPPASPPPFDISSSETLDAPDWMSDLDAGTAANTDSDALSESPFMPTQPTAEEDVPEWMQGISMQAKEEPPAESPSSSDPDFSVSEPDDSSLDAEIVEEETPDWLKDLEGSVSQPEMSETVMPGKPTQEPEVPDWLDDIEQEEAAPIIPETTDSSVEADDIPDWLQDFDSADGQPDEQPETSEIAMPGVTDMLGKPTQEPEVPDWLTDIEQDQAVPAAHPSTKAAAPADDKPDWLQNLEGSDDQPGEQLETPEIAMPGVTDMLGKPTQEPEVPDWLSDIEQEEAAPTIPETTDSSVEADDIPDWLQDLDSSDEQPDENPVTPEIAKPGVTDMLRKPIQEPEVPDWLSDIEQDETLPGTPEPPKAADQADDLPDWLQDLEGSDDQPDEQLEIPEVAMPGVTDMLGKPVQEPEVPDWLSDMDAESDAAPTSDDNSIENIFDQQPAAETPQATDEMPDWLQELDSSDSAKLSATESTPAQAILPASDDELPDWQQADDDTSDLEAALPVAMLNDDESLPQESEEMPEDADEAFAWLESLAAQHGADEEALSTPIEDRDTSVPDWLREIDETAPQTQPEPKSQSDDEMPPENEPALEETDMNDTLPDWLHDLDGSPISDLQEQESSPEQKSQPVPAANGKFTDWLNDLGQETPVAEQSDEEEEEQDQETIPAQPTISASLPDWLQDFSETTESQPEQETESIPAAENLVSDIPSDDQPAASLSVPDWMNDLAEEAPEQSVADSAMEPAEDSQIDLPDWMQADDQTAEELAPAARSASIPDWLEELKPAHSAPTTADEKQSDAVAESAAEIEPLESALPTASSDDETIIRSRIPQDEAQPQDSEEMPEDADDAFAWLESLAAKHGADEEALVTAADERQETPPDWVQGLSSAEETRPENEPTQPDTFSINDLDTGIDLLSAAEETPTEPTLEEQEEAEAKAQQWLQSLASGKPVEDLAAPQEMETSLESAELPAESPAEAADLPSTNEMPSDPDEAFAWLESLAAQHGADEEALSTPPEERDSTTPDWLKDIEEDVVAEPPTQQEVEPVAEDIFDNEEEDETIPSETIDLIQEDEMPSDPAEAFAWLESLAAQQGADEEALSTPPEERDSTTPDWLKDIEEEIDTTESRQESEPVPEDTFPAAEEDEHPAHESPQAELSTEPALPAWLQEFEEPLAETTPAQPEPQDETVVRWLNKLDEEEISASEPVEQPTVSRLASKEVITEPVKPAEKPAAEEMAADSEVESLQPVVEEPVAEIIEASLQAAAPIEQQSFESQFEIETEGETESTEQPDLLTDAQILVSKGQIEESAVIYQKLIKEETQLDAVIKDLNDSLLRHPVNSILWLTLGDAYLQKKEMQSALSAYTKAEELLR